MRTHIRLVRRAYEARQNRGSEARFHLVQAMPRTKLHDSGGKRNSTVTSDLLAYVSSGAASVY